VSPEIKNVRDLNTGNYLVILLKELGKDSAINDTGNIH
jgi:hypothetical protein